MRSLLLMFLIAILAAPVYAEADIVVAPEPLQYCVVCHGVELKGNALVDAPNLSVLSAEYIERQLLNYKQGLRAPQSSADLIGRGMQPMAEHLDEAGINAAVKFVGSVPERTAEPTITGDLSHGKALYQSCATCHGVQGQGNPELNAPRLAGQNDWYLIRQLENFKSGARGAEADDIRGRQMRLSVDVLKDETAIRDVVSYINTLKPQIGD